MRKVGIKINLEKEHPEDQGKNRSGINYFLSFQKANMLEGNKLKSYCVKVLIGHAYEPKYESTVVNNLARTQILLFSKSLTPICFVRLRNLKSHSRYFFDMHIFLTFKRALHNHVGGKHHTCTFFFNKEQEGRLTETL